LNEYSVRGKKQHASREERKIYISSAQRAKDPRWKIESAEDKLASAPPSSSSSPHGSFDMITFCGRNIKQAAVAAMAVANFSFAC
jgi:hypothetical protein